MLHTLIALRYKCVRIYAQSANSFLFAISAFLKKKIIIIIFKMLSLALDCDIFFIEIREGIGGVESESFCSLLYNMYVKFFDRSGAIYEVISLKPTVLGYKRVILRVKAVRIFGLLAMDSGVHRIQRVPKSERSGRVHTSTCIVELYKDTSSKPITLNRREIRVETFKARGPGGQSVNKTNSAVRVVHIPTGITVECQRERSQGENKKVAFALLSAKLEFYAQQRAKIALRTHRDSNVVLYSTRSSKVRTYNLVRGVIVNHVNSKKTFKVKEVIYDGYLDLII
ncbi:PCRF domain-containing protein [Candidatus Vidania fulgoroideae]|uniref:PCRF domain-containing protein n=1 Tax=Candidatus Vidania fulgoroideorum TaxID=881286 RepID=A0A974X920_9PROT|nr:PCRF domain-containing protein [Candidatus Vidania fulgoroideae]